MQAYQKKLSEWRALGASLIALTPEKADHSLTTAQKNALEYDVCSDPGLATARRYGIVFELAEELKPLYQSFGAELPVWNESGTWELAIPATFVIARDGIVKLAFVDADYTHRLEPDAITDCLRELASADSGGRERSAR